MSTLSSHLEQLVVSAKAIEDLEFPAPRIFTNALLGNHEITTLIRDTEPHERALFSVDASVTNKATSTSSRRTTNFGGEGADRRKTGLLGQHRQSSAVAKVLGNDMVKQIQQSSKRHGRSKGVDVEILIQGAERLCAVYTVPGAVERISALRERYSQISSSVADYENKVLKQQARLNRIHTSTNFGEDSDGENIEDTAAGVNISAPLLSEEDLKAEEEVVKQLEARKKALEDRVSDMEKDLGGLLR